jgi:cytidylate kinase
MSKPSTIAIDGPAASGKSTVGSMLAAKLGFRFVDTGQMYRALTWEALQLGMDVDDEKSLIDLAKDTVIEIGANASNRVTVNGRDITTEIHSDAVDRSVSPVSKVSGVRKVLVEKQRAIAGGGRIVMAGRDIGTNVLPGADLKVYLDVSLEEQARRRHNDVIQRGEEADYDTILAELKRRDEIDSKRTANPLRPAGDAVHIDTDRLDEDGVVAEILRIMERM